MDEVTNLEEGLLLLDTSIHRTEVEVADMEASIVAHAHGSRARIFKNVRSLHRMYDSAMDLSEILDERRAMGCLQAAHQLSTHVSRVCGLACRGLPLPKNFLDKVQAEREEQRETQEQLRGGSRLAGGRSVIMQDHREQQTWRDSGGSSRGQGARHTRTGVAEVDGSGPARSDSISPVKSFSGNPAQLATLAAGLGSPTNKKVERTMGILTCSADQNIKLSHLAHPLDKSQFTRWIHQQGFSS